MSEQQKTICTGKLCGEAHSRHTVRTQKGGKRQVDGRARSTAVEASGIFLTLGLGDLVLLALL